MRQKVLVPSSDHRDLPSAYMNILLVKVTLMPLVIGLITVVSRKWGYKVGGLIASMPWIAGPILLFFILEQGKTFGIRSVPGILTGIISLISFCYCYAQLSKRFNWLISILTSYLVYVLVALLFDLFKFNLFLIYAITLACVVLALYFFPVPAAHQPQAKRLPFDMLIRMVVATLFVILITSEVVEDPTLLHPLIEDIGLLHGTRQPPTPLWCRTLKLLLCLRSLD